MKGRESWAPLGYVAYSKLCTHLGCPVGLYEQELQLLVCPCHQSMFNVNNGAVPQFGPAPRPLPQLPLYIDGQGFLRAQAGLQPARRTGASGSAGVSDVQTSHSHAAPCRAKRLREKLLERARYIVQRAMR